jgi:hypothetical protein
MASSGYQVNVNFDKEKGAFFLSIEVCPTDIEPEVPALT